MSSREVWLRSNRRAAWLTLAPLAAIAIGVQAAVALAAVALPATPFIGVLVTFCALLPWSVLLVAYQQIARPRLAYEPGWLLVYARPGPPQRVPIEVVECFFLGQGPAALPGPIQADSKLSETATIVVRLAESAEAWQHFDTPPMLGNWCEGYITIRGTWCERIRPELVKELNAKLVTAQRHLRDQQRESA